MVECHIRDVEVAGSNPVIQTIPDTIRKTDTSGWNILAVVVENAVSVSGQYCGLEE